MGWNQQNVFVVLIVTGGPGSGIFIYSPSPGPGNLIGSWSGTAGVDPYGNAYPAGLSVDQGVLSGVQINGTELILNPGPLLMYGNTATVITYLTGAGNWLAPAGVTSVLAECWGAGHSGGAGGAGIGGGGGGGAEYAAEPALAVTPGNLYAFTQATADGGNSTMAGDVVTVTAHGGGAPSAGGTQGLGGTGSTNTTHFNGGNGGLGNALNGAGGGGGGSAGTISAGNAGHIGVPGGGPGGVAVAGGGPGGAGGASGAVGHAPVNPPGGGGGGGGSAHAGGTFAIGQVRLTYTLSGSSSLIFSLSPSAGTDPPTGAKFPSGLLLGAAYKLLPSGDVSGASDAGALTNAYAAGAEDIQLLPGNWWGVLPGVPDHVQLRGCGGDTIVNLPANSATLAQMITNATNAQVCRISDMTLDGNNANQGAGAWQAGIVLNNPPADGRHIVSRVRIQNFTGDGLVQLNRGSSQFSDIQIFGCNGFGVNAHEDCYYSNVDVGACGLDGFLIQGGSNRFSNCKAFFSGAALVSGRGAGATLLTVTPPAQAFDGGSLTGGFTFSLASGFGSGFHYANIGGSGTTPALNASAGEIAACCAQDNARNGFLLFSRRMALTAIDADSNNNCGTTGGVPNGNYAGVEITGNRNNVQGVSWNRAANVNAQAAALEIVASVSQATLNRVDLGFDGSLNDGSNMPPMTAASTFYDNGITFRTMGGRGFEPHAFAASFTPDPFAAETFQMPLTGNITINAPALAGTNTTGIFLIPGMLMRIILVEDIVGGHTVTFNAVFAGASAANTAAARTNVWTFVFDNQSGNWLECSFQNF